MRCTTDSSADAILKAMDEIAKSRQGRVDDATLKRVKTRMRRLEQQAGKLRQPRRHDGQAAGAAATTRCSRRSGPNRPRPRATSSASSRPSGADQPYRHRPQEKRHDRGRQDGCDRACRRHQIRLIMNKLPRSRLPFRWRSRATLHAQTRAPNGMPAYGQEKSIPGTKIAKQTLAQRPDRLGRAAPESCRAWTSCWRCAARWFAARCPDPGAFAAMLAGMLNEGTTKRDSCAIAESGLQGMGGERVQPGR